MTNVYGLIAPKRILGDIRGVVPNPLKGASNKYKVQVTSITLLSIFLLRRVFSCKMTCRGLGRSTLATQH
jgi:hypothetical protein